MTETRDWDELFESSHPDGERLVRRRRRRRKSGKRRDIQGLRMVAVVAVVVNHLTGHPVGGFVGVDVFFVISGYLMTGILTRELAKSGRTVLGYLGWFYARRARRLLPAALVVIGLTILAAHAVFGASRYHSTVVDGGWAAIFMANWRSIAIGTDYFQSELPPSPLQHYWSLSVEEQFYFGWPLLLLIATTLLFSYGRKWAALVCSVVAVVASAAYAANYSNSVIAYFSTWTRIWELALGGVVFAVAKYVRLRTIPVSIMSMAGLVVIIVSLFTVHPDASFPFPGAMAPCVGSALVLLAASPNGKTRNPFLTNRAAVFVGDISYSVYLVHFPLIVILVAYMDGTSSYYYLAVVAGTLGIATLLYTLVEVPVLQSGFLRPASERAAAADRAKAPTVTVAAGATVLALAALASWPGAQAAADAKLSQIQAAISQSPTASASSSAGPTVAPPLGPAAQQLQDALHQALLATKWPKLTPPLDQPVLGISQQAGCGDTTFEPSKCVWGDPTAKHLMFLVGDSRSAFYSDAFITMVQHLHGWKVRAGGGSDCAFADPPISENTNASKVKQCPQRNATIAAEIKQEKPDLLIVTSGRGDPSSNVKVARELSKVTAYVKKVVILAPPPPTIDPNKCYTKNSSPPDCVVSIPKSWVQSLAQQKSYLVPKFHAAFIDPTDWFCYHGQCPIFVDNVPMKHDQLHITPQYAAHIEPVILEAFEAAKLLP